MLAEVVSAGRGHRDECAAADDEAVGFSDHQAYRAMDSCWMCWMRSPPKVFALVAHLLNLDCDIVFVGTTSTYWELDVPDELREEADDDEQSSRTEMGARRFGHSKDHRDDLPQVVIAMAVTRDGVPIRCWTFPGNTADTAIIRRVDLAGWRLHRMVWVADRGFASAANRAYLTRGGGHYIHAEKLRATNTEAAAALARPGRHRTVADNLRVKDVHVAPGGTGDQVRANLIAHLKQLIDGSDGWTARRRDELVGALRAKPGLRRHLRRTAAGLLRVDAAAAKREANLDGKWLLRTSDTTLTPEDLAAAYKQLTAVERGWRDLKSSLGLRPVHHRREDRIRGHIQLCWLALLLIRVIENTTTDTWRNTRHELDRMHLVTLATAERKVAQRSQATPAGAPSWPPSTYPNHPGSSTSPPPPRPEAQPSRSNTTPALQQPYAQVSPQNRSIVCSPSTELRPVVGEADRGFQGRPTR